LAGPGHHVVVHHAGPMFSPGRPLGTVLGQPPVPPSVGVAPTQVPPLQISNPAQAWPQVPQFSWSWFLFTQRPPHTPKTFPSGHLHWPATHLSLPVHLTPQAPQLSSSEIKFTHEPPQSVAPAVQVTLQVPMLHTALAEPASPTMARQEVVQVPQWSRSFLRSTHTPEQLVVPFGQPQAPPEQSWPAGQTLPQEPQLFGSLAVVTQAPPHEV